MARIEPRTRTIMAELAYFGAPNSGKASNVSWLRNRTCPSGPSGPSHLVVEMGQLAGQRLCAECCIASSQPEHAQSRLRMLQRIDGVVVVVDSSPQRLQANRDALSTLEHDLASLSRALPEVAVVFQFNKRDVAGALDVHELSAFLNHWRMPEHEAVAVWGRGVEATQEMILAEVRAHLHRQLEQGIPHG